MERKLLGVLTEDEVNVIIRIYQRGTALQELIGITPIENDILYDKILADFQNTRKRMADWWTSTASAHNWTYEPTNSWNVDFETREVFLT